MADQRMTPSRFLNLKREYSKDEAKDRMPESTTPEAVRKGDERPSPILKGADRHSSPSSAAQKAVSIAEPEIESISPLMRGKWKEMSTDSDCEYFNLDRPTSKHHRTSMSSKRLSGRPSIEILKQARRTPDIGQTPAESGNDSSTCIRPGSRSSADEELFSRVGQWLQQERARRSAAKKHRRATHHTPEDGTDRTADVHRRPSDASDGTSALDELQKILDRAMSFSKLPMPGFRRHAPRSPNIGAKLRRVSSAGATSDSDHLDDPVVPTCDVVLDNTKTLTYTSKTPLLSAKDSKPMMRRVSSAKVEDVWRTFKFEIVRLTHTLRVKGWRRVPMELSAGIEVERLSGALTNAVYVVSPPKDLPPVNALRAESNDSQPRPRKPPPKLLLRIYGAQVDHLIDRESELAILRRLAKKHIGPRLLGTFANGRFEEFFHARTLTAKDIRDKNMSRQIAKRMRELHEGIDLLPEERAGGPFVWNNINKWTKRCSTLVHWLDSQIRQAGEHESMFVCGTDWDTFFATLEKYKTWLYAQYGGDSKVKERLVFAHNDAQYGNILQLMPSGESPLLLPQNEHKRLVVIDFEYANANPPGLEFANHFTEWCYNYHDEKAPYACNTRGYPTPVEQTSFIKSYIIHRPNLPSSRPGTPYLAGDAYQSPETNMPPPAIPTSGSSSSMISSSFMLDQRKPSSSSFRQNANSGLGSSSSAPNLQSRDSDKYESSDDEAWQKIIDQEINNLLWETRIWRLANSAQWVMWGVMQAKIPHLPVELGGPGDCEHDVESEGETDAAQVRELVLPDSGFVDGDSHSLANDTSTPGIIQLVESPAPIQPDEGTDPLSPEAKAMAQDAKDKRPESGAATAQEAGEESEFDYLAYARERAMFFWGDAVALGIVRREELPERLREGIRVVEY